MKPRIQAAIPEIKIGGKAGSSSVEHLVVIQIWMKDMEINEGNGIFQGFNIEKTPYIFCIPRAS